MLGGAWSGISRGEEGPWRGQLGTRIMRIVRVNRHTRTSRMISLLKTTAVIRRNMICRRMRFAREHVDEVTNCND